MERGGQTNKKERTKLARTKASGSLEKEEKEMKRGRKVQTREGRAARAVAERDIVSPRKKNKKEIKPSEPTHPLAASVSDFLSSLWPDWGSLLTENASFLATLLCLPSAGSVRT